jgi:hypothetical protein
MRRWSPALLVLGVALVGCGPGGGDGKPAPGDQVKPELPRVTVKVDGMT